MTIVVVEDEFLVRIAITFDLIAEGYDVLAASNAEQAIKILESRNEIETIFTDIEMPGSMDGLKLARAVRHRWPPGTLLLPPGIVGPLAMKCRKIAASSQNRIKLKMVLSALRAFL